MSTRAERHERASAGGTLDESDLRRQSRLGAFNRRIAAETEKLARYGMAANDHRARFLCACGQPDCSEALTLDLSEYDTVRGAPTRFLVAPGHDGAADRVVERHDRYWIVEVRTGVPADKSGLALTAHARPRLSDPLTRSDRIE